MRTSRTVPPSRGRQARPALRPSRVSLLVLALGLVPGLAAAAPLAPPAEQTPYLAIKGFYLVTDDDRQTDDGTGLHVAVGRPLGDPWWLEFNVATAVLDRGDRMGSDFYQYNLGADLAYAFGNRDELTPYLLAGAGASYNDIVPSANDGWDYAVHAGAGLTRRFLGYEGLRWRLETRAIYDNFLDGNVDVRISAGIEFALRKPAPAPEPVVREVVREVEVIREVVREVPVATPGENPDLDGDGVLNAVDKCPDTPRGAKVDGSGCVVEQTLTMRDVTFMTASAKLTVNGRRILDTVVAFLRAEPGINVSVEGHTDSRGSDAYNQKLSQARAESVRDYLVQKGIAADRLEARGFGESRPVASNDTDEGRENNRRVEFVLRKAQ